MLEREAKREKTLESSAREKRLKAAQKRPNSGAMKPTGSAYDELLKLAEEEFYGYIDDGTGQIKDAAAARAREFDSSIHK